MGHPIPEDILGYLGDFLGPVELVKLSQSNKTVKTVVKGRCLELIKRQRLFQSIKKAKGQICRGQVYLGKTLGIVKCTANVSCDSVYCGICNSYIR